MNDSGDRRSNLNSKILSQLMSWNGIMAIDHLYKINRIHCGVQVDLLEFTLPPDSRWRYDNLSKAEEAGHYCHGDYYWKLVLHTGHFS
jgi:hypothetical protein